MGRRGCLKVMTKEATSATVNPDTLYVYRGALLHRYKGRECHLIWQTNSRACIVFEDGYKVTVPRYVIRRKRGAP